MGLEKNIFLTGDRGVGKSTIIRKVVEGVSHKQFCGFITFKGEDGIRIRDIVSGSEGFIGKFNDKKVLPYIESFETIGVNALKREGDIVIMDELGYLELEAYEFQLQVIKVLGSSIPVLGVLRNEKNIFLEKVGAISEVVEVKLENRDALPEILLRKIKGLLEESI